MIEEKVKLINKKYGKSWRAEKSRKYYCIDSTFDIDKKYENFKDEDEERYTFGNYFKTEKEAQEYAEYMKKCSLEWHEKEG